MRRIVNIYNFVRAIEPRDPAITRDVLWQTTARQVECVKTSALPSTWALQYDALIDPRYPELLNEELDERDEIGAWWEIVQPLVERAGLKWRGRYPWDWHAHVGFSPGYTPAEREKLVDVYMQEFRDVFGRYPETVGSWFIDERTLAYMAARYGVLASCNCKDQIGTDGYTLWGGYWNQAYYPSRCNAYMPAQHERDQIPIPIFRMLGSDPIYQYDSGLGGARQDVVSLEPVYPDGGGNPDWVRWFMAIQAEAPGLAFTYVQVGQENSFTWNKMARGFQIQIPMIAEWAKAGKLEVETLADTGRWFRSRFRVTPATAVVAMKDWRKEGRRTVWYDSRFYRVNLLWKGPDFHVRDIHVFDETYISPYYDTPLTQSACLYDTLPVLDGFHWSTSREVAGLRLRRGTPAGAVDPVRILSVAVKESGASELRVSCEIEGGDLFDIHCGEERLEFHVSSRHPRTEYFLAMTWSPDRNPPIEAVTRDTITYVHRGFSYRIRCLRGYFTIMNAGPSAKSGGLPYQGIAMVPEQGAVILDLRQQEG